MARNIDLLQLRLKKNRILKQHREGYIEDEAFDGEYLPGTAALWDVATPEELYERVTILLEPKGLFYDTELNMIAALKPRRQAPQPPDRLIQERACFEACNTASLNGVCAMMRSSRVRRR